jgi:hypothetical protein
VEWNASVDRRGRAGAGRGNDCSSSMRRNSARHAG